MVKVTLSLDMPLWRAFRIACFARGTSASKEIRRLVSEQLQQWQAEAPRIINTEQKGTTP